MKLVKTGIVEFSVSCRLVTMPAALCFMVLRGTVATPETALPNCRPD